MTDVIQNAVKITEDGVETYLPSTCRHHYNEYTFKDGATYAVDGGTDYVRRGFSENIDDKQIENYNLDSSCAFETICEKLIWGSMGKSGMDKLSYHPFAKLELDHLNSILNYNKKLKITLSKLQIKVIKHWISKKS